MHVLMDHPQLPFVRCRNNDPVYSDHRYLTNSTTAIVYQLHFISIIILSPIDLVQHLPDRADIPLVRAHFPTAFIMFTGER